MKKITLLLVAILCLGLNTYISAQQNITKYIKVYFTQAVDNTYSNNGVDAVQLNNIVFDTLAAYINRAKYSIDIAQYEYQTYTGDPIYTAINNAYTRGVKIRYIQDQSQAATNTGVAKLNASIPVVTSPTDGSTACNGEDYNIMHNKFVIIDEYSPDTTNAIVWTGSPDWDAAMSLGDYNNVIIFQSKVLARAYTNEFDIMWGDTTHGGAADASKEKFGACKPNSGTHIFHIGGSEVELYFSPSDTVNNHIISTIQSANVDLYCGMFTFTETTNATDIVNQKTAGASAYAILDKYSSGSYTPYTTILPNGLGADFTGYNNASYLYHNKYLVVNPSAPCDNPKVLTGSHNWTASANSENDENTVIVHNDTIANEYLQAFASDFKVISGNAVTKITNPCPGTPTFTATVAVNTEASECTNTGEATVTASGGTTPYTYSWSTTPAQTTAAATGLSAGNYTVTVKDNGGSSVTATATITAPAGVTASTTINTEASECSSIGKATATASGGTSPYTYSWSSGASVAAATGLSAGSYTVTVTDKNGCTATATATITAPAGVSTNAAVNTNATACANTGKATATASGGTSPYTYTWTGGQTNAAATGLSAGSYTITVKDKNGCSGTASVTITAPAGLGLSTNATDVTCHGNNNGIASSTVTGGTTPYTYTWTGGQTNSSATGLSAGTYTLTVKDNNNCSTSAMVVITQPATSLSASATTTSNVSCSTTGSISSSVSGGSTPYTYSWSPSGGNGSTASLLSAGTYTLSITDKNGCTASASTIITQPANSLSASATVTANITCNGNSNGSVSSTVSGGTTPYTYSWTNGAGTNATASGLSADTYILVVTDNAGCSSSTSVSITQPQVLNVSTHATGNGTCNGSNNGTAAANVSGGTAPYTYLWSGGAGTNSTANGLSAGTYMLVVTDANGCFTSTASVTITQPTLLTASANATANVTCNGNSNGSVSSSVSGGSTPYTYSWNNGAGSNSTANGLSANTYVVTVTDNHGCSTSAFVTITEPAILNASANVTANVSCNGNTNGSASSSVSGGTTPYTYSWSNGAGTNNTANGLSAGTYILHVTDKNGCSTSADVVITQPAIMDVTTYSVTAGTSTKDCNGIAAVTVVSGGTAPFTYNWSPGNATTDTIQGQCAGSYCCTITDNNGCTESTCVTISVNSTGINNIPSASAQITLYPNPSTGKFNIQMENGQLAVDHEKPRLEIYDELGKQIFLQLSIVNFPLSINVSSQPDGVYFYRVITESGNLIGEGKLIIQK